MNISDKNSCSGSERTAILQKCLRKASCFWLSRGQVELWKVNDIFHRQLEALVGDSSRSNPYPNPWLNILFHSCPISSDRQRMEHSSDGRGHRCTRYTYICSEQKKTFRNAKSTTNLNACSFNNVLQVEASQSTRNLLKTILFSDRDHFLFWGESYLIQDLIEWLVWEYLTRLSYLLWRISLLQFRFFY